ncbi:hypothetical protein [Paenibacillus sabinae]|uniref:Uncharacterized protein n=1 Tax=Paenibacillus sabinae T27 TaxID=1268072 RepID=X4ZED5_9BACL|nr:hypothetical protein [Paenibacillus sabinae]AHV97891.1 hypothetical protein PSAB_14910 [Paenibacillus sabinae T27]
MARLALHKLEKRLVLRVRRLRPVGGERCLWPVTVRSPRSQKEKAQAAFQAVRVTAGSLRLLRKAADSGAGRGRRMQMQGAEAACFPQAAESKQRRRTAMARQGLNALEYR